MFERVPAATMAAALIPMLLGGLLLLGPCPAAAHAIVLESAPTPDAVLARPPERVILRFNSKIEKRLTRVTLAASGGTPRPMSIASIGRGDDQAPDRIVVPLNPLPPGRYVIRYRVLSADGHVTEGALRFTLNAGQ